MRIMKILEDVVKDADVDEIIKKELEDNNIKLELVYEEKELKDKLAFMIANSKPLIITDKGFAGEYLDSLGIDASIFKISREDLKNVDKAKRDALRHDSKAIVGFGGGRALDVAKKTAYDLGIKLVLIPTAPSHDGVISRTASLYNDGIKKSFLCKYPTRILAPLYLWSSAERHKRAGTLDVLSNIISLQDVFLANRMIGETIKERELKLASLSIILISKLHSLDDLAMAIFSSALAMRDSSRYCSGCEHELEKALAPHFPQYMHGELVGLSSLICAEIYKTSKDVLPEELLFPLDVLPEELFEIYRKKGLGVVISHFLEDENFMKNAPELMKKASTIRPERYTLWNVVDSAKVDFEDLLNKIRIKLEHL